MKYTDTAIQRWWRNWNKFSFECDSRRIEVRNFTESPTPWRCFIGYKDYDSISDAKCRPEFIRDKHKKYGFKFKILNAGLVHQ